MRHHQQHRFGIHHRLGVVALLEATAGHLHDPRVLVGQIDLIFGAWRRIGRLGFLAARLLSGHGFLGCTRRHLGVVLGALAFEAFFGARLDLCLGHRNGGQPVFPQLDLVG